MKSELQFLISIFFLVISWSAFAQVDDNLNIKTEIELATAKEQHAFKNGDCDTVLSMMDDNITFLANGRKVPSKKVIANFCNSIKRPFKMPLVDNMDVYVLSNSAAYTVRTLHYERDENITMQEYVTKIWKKIDGNWKITHLHSTVKEQNNQ